MGVEQQTAKLWDILVHQASQRTFITYTEIKKEMDISMVPASFWYMRRIQEYCLQNLLPPLTILAAKADGVPGAGFIAWPPENLEEGRELVYAKNWNDIVNPWGYSLEGQTEKGLVRRLQTNPNESGTVYRLVKDRGMIQILFRKLLLKAYRGKCCICKMNHEVVLEACHIVPWNVSSQEQRLDVRNGILLCANHHKLFDKGLIEVKEDYSISFKPIIVNVFEGIIPKSIEKPIKTDYLPLRENLAHRLRINSANKKDT
jgi:putative restriction endonuclease